MNPIRPNVDSGSAKYSDAAINALKTNDSNEQHYRVTSNSLGTSWGGVACGVLLPRGVHIRSHGAV